MTGPRRITDQQRAALLIIPTLAPVIAVMRADVAGLDADIGKARRGDTAGIADLGSHRDRAVWRLDGAMHLLDAIVSQARNGSRTG